jgi:hypothetical protein
MTTWISSLFFRQSIWTQIKNEGCSLECHLDVNGVLLEEETIQGKLRSKVDQFVIFDYVWSSFEERFNSRINVLQKC